MYKEFCVTGITHSIADRNIIVETNFKLDPASITMNTVKLRNSSSGEIVDYTLSSKGKNIEITFKQWPTPNTEYFLSIANIKDALERTLKNNIDQTIIFESSDIKHKVSIVEPVNGTAIEDNIIKVIVKATPEDEPVKGYYYEISSDVAFCDNISILSVSNEVAFKDVPTGQCFVRCRVQDLDDDSIYGDWSETTTFIALNSNDVLDDDNNNDNDTTEEDKDNNCNHPTPSIIDDNPFIEDILSLRTVLTDVKPVNLISVPANGKTQQSIYLVFDQEIDIDSLPERIVAYRRDL